MTPLQEVLSQWPLLLIVFGVLAAVLGAIGTTVNKVWIEYKAARNADLAWREVQNKKREDATAEQNRLWRQAMEDRDKRYEQLDRERENKIVDLASMIREIAAILQAHDAKTDTALVIMKERTTPLPRKRND